MSFIYGGIDYSKLVELLQKLFVLKEVSNVVAAAGADTTVISETSIEDYKYKTITIKADYALEVKVYCYDSSSEYDANDPYYSTTLTANKTKVISFEEDFKYCRIVVNNPDSSSHTVTFARLKGRRL